MGWTHFWDMHSGGGQKLAWAHIYIEADEAEAKVVFYNRFGRNPERVTCTCCGEDYAIDTGATLAEVTGYQRGCDYDGDGIVERPGRFSSGHITLDEYLVSGGTGLCASGPPLVIPADEITDDERHGNVPAEGYVWAGES